LKLPCEPPPPASRNNPKARAGFKLLIKTRCSFGSFYA
jgi:hypothetical protein